MKARGAVVRQAPGKFEVVDLEVDDPRRGEIRVKMVASGLCHTDDHIATGDLPVATYPFAGGHEGGGIVESMGPDTPGFAVGDKVVFSVLPACGQCEWCAAGRSNLCDMGATILIGSRWEDPTDFRLHLPDGTPVGQMSGISTYCEYTTVSTISAIKVPDDTHLESACPARSSMTHRVGHSRLPPAVTGLRLAAADELEPRAGAVDAAGGGFRLPA